MILPIHIIIALSSLVFSSFLFMRPSRSHFRINYVMIALTIVSGTYLAFQAPAHILHTCITGLVYLSIASAATIAAHAKFARASHFE